MSNNVTAKYQISSDSGMPNPNTFVVDKWDTMSRTASIASGL